MSTELISLTTSCPDKPAYKGDDFPILVSSEAITQFIKANETDPDLIRVKALGGGCSGYKYDLDFVKESKGTDLVKVFEKDQDSVTLIIDPKSAHVLQGTTIDYTTSRLGTSGFKFIGGDQVKRTCGCGESFSV